MNDVGSLEFIVACACTAVGVALYVWEVHFRGRRVETGSEARSGFVEFMGLRTVGSLGYVLAVMGAIKLLFFMKVFEMLAR